MLQQMAMWLCYSSFIVFECLETPVKPDPQVFEIAFVIASQSHLKNKKIEVLTNFSHVVGKFVVLIFKSRNEFIRVWCFIKLKGLILYETFTGVSNHTQVMKLACHGWIITLWIINEFENSLSVFQISLIDNSHDFTTLKFCSKCPTTCSSFLLLSHSAWKCLCCEEKILYWSPMGLKGLWL